MIVSVVVLIIFAIIGICSLVREIFYFLFRIKNDCTITMITPVSQGDVNIEFMLRSTAERFKSLSHSRDDCVICLDCDMDDNTKEICKKLRNEYGFIRILSKDELIKKLENNKK